MTLRLDLLEAGTTQVFDALFPAATVLWTPSEADRADTNDVLLTMRRISGGWATDSQHTPQPVDVLPTEGVLTVTGDSADARTCIVYAAGLSWRVPVGAGTSDADFLTAIRDALATVGYSIDAVLVLTATDLTITGTELASLVGLRVVADASVDLTTTRGKAVTGYEMSTVEVQAHSLNRYPSTGAHAVMSKLLASLRLPSTTAILDLRGISLWDVGSIIDLTALSGPTWESRAALDLVFVQRSFIAEPIDAVAKVVVTMTPDETTPQTLEVIAP